MNTPELETEVRTLRAQLETEQEIREAAETNLNNLYAIVIGIRDEINTPVAGLAIEIRNHVKQLREQVRRLSEERESRLTPSPCGVSGHFRFQLNGGNCMMCQREEQLVKRATDTLKAELAKASMGRGEAVTAMENMRDQRDTARHYLKREQDAHAKTREERDFARRKLHERDVQLSKIRATEARANTELNVPTLLNVILGELREINRNTKAVAAPPTPAPVPHGHPAWPDDPLDSPDKQH